MTRRDKYGRPISVWDEHIDALSDAIATLNTLAEAMDQRLAADAADPVKQARDQLRDVRFDLGAIASYEKYPHGD